jgi:glycosyltransferase involved in cell wall biosynthesis
MKVSVIIPLYNKEPYIGRTLDSVLAQTFTDYEIVVIDDGSTDGSAAVVRGYTDPRIRLIAQPNAGQGAARDRGMREAQGEHFVFLDADDEWHPACLARLIALITDFPQAGAVGVKYAMIDEDGSVTPAQLSALPADFTRGLLPDYYANAMLDTPLWSSSTLIPRRVIDEVRPKYSTSVFGEDLYLWCQIANRYPIGYDSAVSAYYHRDAGGRVSTTRTMQGELPFVGLLLDELGAGRLRHLNRASVRAYIAKFQFDAMWALLEQGAPVEQVRPLLHRCPRTRDNAREWRHYQKRLYGSRRDNMRRMLQAVLRPLWRPIENLLTRKARHAARHAAPPGGGA